MKNLDYTKIILSNMAIAPTVFNTINLELFLFHIAAMNIIFFAIGWYKMKEPSNSEILENLFIERNFEDKIIVYPTEKGWKQIEETHYNKHKEKHNYFEIVALFELRKAPKDGFICNLRELYQYFGYRISDNINEKFIDNTFQIPKK